MDLFNNMQNNNFENNQNIYPTCKITESENKNNFTSQNNISSNNSQNLLSSLMSLLMNGENINYSQIIKNLMPQNPLISSLLSNFENNNKNKENKNNLSNKIDVSSLNKIN